MKLGLLREEKIPHDRRVAFTPEQCRRIAQDRPGMALFAQPSPHRCFADREYAAAGVVLAEDLSGCDLLMGIKEVPPALLLPGKRYAFFSHTVKKQPHNRGLLRAVLANRVELIDYECLVDEDGNRVIGFGRYAGIVGAYNALMGYGRKYGLYDLKPAHECKDKRETFLQLDKVTLPNVKIAVTGGGRVGNGACETLGALGLRKVTPYEFLHYTFREAVYVQLQSEDYYTARDGAPFSSAEFHRRPADFRCTFGDDDSFATVTDILIHCAYWDPRADILFSKKRMQDPAFRISVIADITCDIEGSIPSTFRASTIEDKFYGYDPVAEKETDPLAARAILVMAIDNLPCELPRDASEGFGKHFLERVLPALAGKDDGLIERATIARDGRLTERFAFLSDYAA
jgi:alanine dehydrogenase